MTIGDMIGRAVVTISLLVFPFNHPTNTKITATFMSNIKQTMMKPVCAMKNISMQDSASIVVKE